MQLNNDNIEEYILLLADDELSEQEGVEVQQYISQHKTYQPMLDAYLAARLDAGEGSYIFQDKNSLLKPETEVVPLKLRVSPVRIAATLVLVMGIGTALTLMLSRSDINHEENTPLQAGKNVNTAIIRPSVRITADSPQVAALVKPKVDKVTVPAAKHNAQSLKNNSQVVVAYTKERSITVAPAQLEDAALNKVELSERKTEQTIAVAEQSPFGVQPRESKGIPQWLPVNEENLQGINSLIDHIQSLKEGIQEKAQSLKSTALVIRIGERQFSIGK